MSDSYSQLGVIRKSQTGQEIGPVFSSSERNGTISYHFCSQRTEQYDT